MSAQEQLAVILTAIADRIEGMDIQRDDRYAIERALKEAKLLVVSD